MGLSLVLAHGNVVEAFHERQRRVDEDAVGEGDARAAGGRRVGEHELHHLLGERVQPLSRPSSWDTEEGDELIARGAARAGRDEAERDVEGQRGEGDVPPGATRRVRRGGQGGGEAEREGGLVGDGDAEVGGHGHRGAAAEEAVSWTGETLERRRGEGRRKCNFYEFQGVVWLFVGARRGWLTADGAAWSAS